MHPYIAFACAVVLCILIHTAAIVITARLNKVVIREVSFGAGPSLFRRSRLQIKILPIASSVRFKDTRTELLEEGETEGALDRQKLSVQWLITLSGCLALLILAFAMLGPDAADVFIHAFSVLAMATLSPFSTAQTLLHSAADFILHAPFFNMLSIGAAILAAINLLPLLGTNGSAAILLLLRGLGINKEPSQDVLKIWGGLSLCVGLSWLAALITFSIS
ncbi:site-2 protease family protein [Undibacterium terreum]|uniref:Peptidase M50 domain-containing protein n=1 Tax=Undibacterium terreum TaxID=1224302 RepID=A0A916XCR7_9BURK|nr:site-2 protease family protein [Undibacterium terreum]GGC64358.1 hypothetical protein GCM10011396_09150 [Undibacterium terreum]